MFRHPFRFAPLEAGALSMVLLFAAFGAADSGKSESGLAWQSPARWHHGLTSTAGTLVIDAQGIEFRSEHRPPQRWPLGEIKTFELTSRRLMLTGYENRGWRLPGERRFRFDLATSVPPAVAAQLAERVAKPVRNGEPEPNAASFSTLAVHHVMRWGGSNGTLRLREGGIDYVTTSGRDARSWRWSDIETLANPDPYHLRVAGYLETMEFELKQPLPREVFERLWDKVYTRGLHGLATKAGEGESVPHESQTN